jgi:ZIP family zinc transporter
MLVVKGWPRARMTIMWSAVVLACGGAAALGYIFGTTSADAFGGRAAALASGGLLAMLTNSLIPFSYERAGAMAGVGTVIGFALALAAA